MSNTKHTPGPWRVTAVETHDEDYSAPFTLGIETEEDHVILFRHEAWPDKGQNHAEMTANVTLAATAPELLGALEAITNGGNLDYGSYWKVDVDDINRARAAIAKAKGQR